MYIKIYFDNKPLFLCDEITGEISDYAKHEDSILIDEFSSAAINSILHEMRLEKVHAGIFCHHDLGKLKKSFWKKFQVIQAGGGLVLNKNKEPLFIFRRGKWDLPKGKLEKGEDLSTCAIREVKEETGLINVTIGKFLLTTYHTYDENGRHLLKESYWYLMEAISEEALVPQQEEQITELKWVAEKNMPLILKNTFPSICDVLKVAGVGKTDR